MPEAQLDRFMLKVIVEYPSRHEEREILDRMVTTSPEAPTSVIGDKHILRARQAVQSIYIDEKIKDYVLDIVFATRQPSEHGLKNLQQLIEVGASPRATIFLLRTAMAYAFLQGRGYVIPDDIKRIAADVLRHRIVVSFEAEAEDISSDHIIQQVLNRVNIP